MLAVAGIMMACASAVRGDVVRVSPDLYTTAKSQGVVRVIVRLAAREPGPQAIAEAQNEVLAALTGTTHRILQRYAASPYLALEVGADALKVLEQAPNVLTVVADFPLRPMGSGALQ